MATTKEPLAQVIHAGGIRKMALEDRQHVEQERRELMDQLSRAEGNDHTAPRPELLQNVPNIKRRIAHLEKLLEQDDDLIPKGADKDRLVARRKEIEAIIKKEMPSEREQAIRAQSSQSDFERAVLKTMHHQKKYGALIQEWQEIMRRLEPEDPTAADVAKLQ